MTVLSVYWDRDLFSPELVTRDRLVVAAHLAHAGILFEWWEADSGLPPDAAPEAVLAAYAAPVERLKQERCFRAADVARVTPDTAGLEELRHRFMREHTHTEDEARFFVQGGGCFYLHIGDRVYRIECERGNLISIPAGTRHWFDIGRPPRFTAIRLFTRPDGWVATYTGSDIADRLQPRRAA